MYTIHQILSLNYFSTTTLVVRIFYPHQHLVIDPLLEFVEQLKATGDRNDWNLSKQLTPKMRTYVPVLVRGEESEGIKFWGFGKTVYQPTSSLLDPTLW